MLLPVVLKVFRGKVDPADHPQFDASTSELRESLFLELQIIDKTCTNEQINAVHCFGENFCVFVY